MKLRENRKMTFWFIGLGCGMIISGIVMMIYILACENTLVKQNGNSVEANKIYDEGTEESKSGLGVLPDKQVSFVLEELKEEIIGLKKERDHEDKTQQYIELDIEKVNEDEKIKVFIMEDMGATQICKLLKEAGVIENEKNFFDYVVAHGKTKYLKHGWIEFPKAGTNEEILDRLVAK